MKTIRRLLFWLCVVASLVAAGFWLSRTEPPLVAVHTVGQGRVEATVANTRAGTVNAHRRAKLAPSLGGRVDVLHVKEGDRVQRGQVLLELWHADLDAELALARSESERAAALAEQAKLQAEFAERDADRQKELQEQKIGAGSNVDRLVSAARAARAAERAAAAEAVSRGARIVAIEAQISRMHLVAPFDGIIAEVNGEIGEFVTPSPVGIPTPPAIDLIDDGIPYVTAPIDEVDGARVRVGMSARITLDAFGKRIFDGRVRRIAPYVTDREKQARTVDVEVEFISPPDDVQLLPGYSADVEILLDTRENVLRIPSECLREGTTVLVVAADDVLQTRQVDIGLANWRFVEVIAGLKAGERIVDSYDLKDLGPGTLVRVGADGKQP